MSVSGGLLPLESVQGTCCRKFQRRLFDFTVLTNASWWCKLGALDPGLRRFLACTIFITTTVRVGCSWSGWFY